MFFGFKQVSFHAFFKNAPFTARRILYNKQTDCDQVDPLFDKQSNLM